MRNKSFKRSINSLDEIDVDINMDTQSAVTHFVSEYPEYANMDQEQLREDIEILRSTPVIDLVRDYFKLNGYDLALTLFNHSLVDNPEDAYMDLTGNTSGMYGYIKRLLIQDGFFGQMLSFARRSTSPGSIVNGGDWSFEDGDLYYSIHLFNWYRSRLAYDHAIFEIRDTYDFDSMTIPGIVATMAGTNDYNVVIAGTVEGGALI